MYLENETYHSYTFPIYFNNEDVNNNIYNLFFSLNTNDSYDVFIVTYALTQEERINLDNGVYVDLEGKSSMEYLYDFDTDVVLNSLMIFIDPFTGEATCFDDSYFYVDENTGFDVTVYPIIPCPGPASNSGDSGTTGSTSGTGSPTGNNDNTATNSNPGDTTTSGSNTGSYSGTGTPSTTNNPATSINVQSLETQRKKTFKYTHLTLEQNLSFSSFPVETQNAIFNYLESQLLNNDGLSLNEYTPDSVETAQSIIAFLDANPGEEEFVEEVIDILSDNPELEFEDIIFIPLDFIDEDLLSVDLLTDECALNILVNEIIGTETSSGTGALFINSIRQIMNDPLVTIGYRNSDTVDPDANAATSFPSDADIATGEYSIITGVSNEYFSGNPTKLYTALVFIHEMAHTKIIYSYLHGNLATDYPIDDYPNFEDLNTAILNFLDDRDENADALDDAMHIAMVDLIGTMSYSLYKYAQRAGMDNITKEYCKDITKGSFYNTPAMPLIDTGDNTPEQLNNKSFDEQNNTVDAQGDDC